MMDWYDALGQYKENGFPIAEASLRLAVAMVLGLLVGFERERRDHPAGMRTHAVVSMAAGLFMLVSIYGLPQVDGQPQDPGRIAAQVVTGIGFLGAGVIFTRRNAIHGLTTAASIWAVAGVGLAAGGGLLITATIATVLLLLVQGGLRPLKKRLFPEDEQPHQLELDLDAGAYSSVLAMLEGDMNGARVRLQKLDLGRPNAAGDRSLTLRLELRGNVELPVVLGRLEALPGVRGVSWKYAANGT